MNWLWLLPAVLAITLLITFFPVFSRRGHQPLHAGLEGDPRAALEDQRELLLRQLKEIELDSQAGSVTSEGALALRSSLEQELAQLLTQLDATPNLPPPASEAPSNRSLDIAVTVAVMLVILVLSGGGYWYLGTPVAPQSTGHGPQGAAGDLRQMVEGLAQRLKNEPDNLDGWLRLGRSYAFLNRLPEALAAYNHVLSRDPSNEDAAVAVAALQIRSQDGEAVRAGMEMFESILLKNPNQPDALWYSGINALNKGDTLRALTLWKKLRGILPPNSQGRTTVEEAIQEVEAGGTGK
ncbi:MAG: c-type cytochrome biogenesis protein CcmI [Magnetococcales bacterium]|nr:c-type cytochrome biogenesis protein CcmI [Magnetococcales bacterium]NGZ26089.1 c-type cytochrome biogenesis protein CcmI [Magnetococcales bacterium]